MKFGTFLTSMRPERIASHARRAEECGFESAWIGEHIIMPVKSQSKYPYSADGSFPAPSDVPFHDPLLVLAFVAAATTKLRLATGIYVVPIRNHVTTAKAIASLDVLSNGRVIFGIGVGWWAEEFAVVGASFNDRALRTRESIELMKALWTQDDPVYRGKTVSIEGVKFNPKPMQKPHPPIVVGGTSDLALKRTARYGDGWYGIAKTLEEARTLIARLREHERTAGRSQPVEVTLSLRTGHALTLDEAKQLAALGVDRALVGMPVRALNDDDLPRVRDEIISKL